MKTKDMNLITWILVSIIILGFILLLNSKAFGQEWTAEQKEVMEAIQTYWEAVKNGDVEAVMAVKHDDVVEWSANNPFPVKKEDIKFNLKGWIQYEKPNSFKLEFYAINIFSNVANAFYSYRFEGKSGNIFRGRSIATFLKKDNKWLSIGSMSSSCDSLPPCPY